MKKVQESVCPDCGETVSSGLNRRQFLKSASSAAAVGSSVFWAVPRATAAPTPSSASETAVKALYESLTEQQKKVVSFDWDYVHPKRGLLRTHSSNNWHITKPGIASDFFTKKQQTLIHEAFKSLFTPQWYKKLLKQGEDDSRRPWGERHNIAIFGKPGDGKFEMVITGRHLTVRADGNTESHVALGGPRNHGHAASGFHEKVGHPGNIFWHQAIEANRIYGMLSGKQRKQALVEKLPTEHHVGFQGPDGRFPGIPISELTGDQKELAQKVLMSMVEPYRKQDREETLHSLKQQGGLEKCSLAFYKQGDLGNDQQWDNWRIEGPAFVWYFRGFPHVHIWINVADDPAVELNSQQL